MLTLNSCGMVTTRSKWDYVPLILLIGISANPHLSYLNFYFIAGLIISAVLFYKSETEVRSSAEYLPFVLVLGIEIIHGILFKFYPVTILRLMSYMLFGYFTIKIFGKEFLSAYSMVITYWSLLAGFFYVLNYFDGISNFLINHVAVLFPVNIDPQGDSTPTILFFTYNPFVRINQGFLMRNPGFAWEPGGFACFIVPALFFNFLKDKKLDIWQTLRKQDNLILILSLLTTFSTSGYLALFLMLIVFFIDQNTLIKYIWVLPILLFIFFKVFTTSEFLGKKISGQLSEAGLKSNRFTAFIMDWQLIKQKPLFGWSRKEEAQFGFSYQQARSGRRLVLIHRPNGISRFLASYGFIYVLIVFYLYGLGISRVYNYYWPDEGSMFICSLFIIILLILGFSQLIFDKPLFRALMFIPFIFLCNEKQKNSNNR